MSEIIIENINGKIWHLDKKIAEIIFSLLNDNFTSISLNSEGPCLEDIGLYDSLDFIFNTFNIDRKKIIIETSNLIEFHSQYNIKKSFKNDLVHFKDYQYSIKEGLSDEFKHLGSFCARSNLGRLWLMSYIFKKYKNKLFGSFYWDKQTEFHLNHIGLESMFTFDAFFSEIKDALHLLENPIILEEVSSFPILEEKSISILNQYHKFFIELVFETYFSGNTFHPTEKIWRPIFAKKPFIVFGPTEFLLNLKKLGFKTFDIWWSEEYDDYGEQDRIVHIKKIIDWIMSLSTSDLRNMYSEMLPILEHNKNLMMELTPETIENIFDE